MGALTGQNEPERGRHSKRAVDLLDAIDDEDTTPKKKKRKKKKKKKKRTTLRGGSGYDIKQHIKNVEKRYGRQQQLRRMFNSLVRGET